MRSRRPQTLLAISLSISLTMLAGCGRPAPPASAERPAAAATGSRPGAFPRAELIEDARQLARILEDSHPDPYVNGGGRIAFHRRLHQVLNAIPEDGMTRDEFFRLLRPFVAGVGDAHTNFLGGYEVDPRWPTGLPVRLRVVEQSLVVAGVARNEDREWIGARVVSVEGVSLQELLDRQRRLRGIDNPYHGLQTLADESLRYAPHLRDLIPEWKDAARVRVDLERPGAGIETAEFTVPRGEVSWIGPKTRAALPVPDESGFRFSFLKAPGSGKEIGHLRFTHMVGYRETRERREPVLTMLRRPPAATEVFRSMVVEMKKRGTDTLVLDVRGNSGGDAQIVEILVYFLYGREALRKTLGFGAGETGVFRYSALYFADRRDESLEAINADRVVPLVEGDYEFSWSYVNGEPIAKRRTPPEEPLGFRYLRDSPTFWPEFESGAYAGYYSPKQVIVLCDAGTLSAGLSVVVTFHRLGAILVGTPSAQAPNSFGAAAVWKLQHTGIRGMVPMIAATHFPDDPDKAHLLPVDHPLTYERLVSYDFDPNAEYLLAMDLP